MKASTQGSTSSRGWSFHPPRSSSCSLNYQVSVYSTVECRRRVTLLHTSNRASNAALFIVYIIGCQNGLVQIGVGVRGWHRGRAGEGVAAGETARDEGGDVGSGEWRGLGGQEVRMRAIEDWIDLLIILFSIFYHYPFKRLWQCAHSGCLPLLPLPDVARLLAHPHACLIVPALNTLKQQSPISLQHFQNPTLSRQSFHPSLLQLILLTIITAMPKPIPKSHTAPPSRHSSARKPAPACDWSDLLHQITSVTQKVRQLCGASSPKPTTPHTTHTTHNTHATHNFAQTQQAGKKYVKFTLDDGNDQQCNTKCHMLMYECMKLSKQNRRLNIEREDLERKLYIESREKRELWWLLQREKNKATPMHSNYKCNKKGNTSVELRRSRQHSHAREDTNNQIQSIKLSQFSTLSAKKASPLVQRTNLPNSCKPPRTPNPHTEHSCKQRTLPKQQSKADSLLLDFSQTEDPDNDNYNSENKPRRSVLEKQLNELLQAGEKEGDREKKKELRRRMQEVSKKLKAMK